MNTLNMDQDEQRGCLVPSRSRKAGIQGQQGCSGTQDVGLAAALDFDQPQEGVYCCHNNGSSTAGSFPVCWAGGAGTPRGCMNFPLSGRRV